MAARHATRHAAHRAAWWTLRLRPARGFSPGLALLVATSFVTGAATQVTWAQVESDAARAARATAERAAVRAEAARVARVDAAATGRLSEQATAYLAHRRTEALAVASGAVAAGEVLTAGSADLLPAEQVAALDAAVAELASLVARTPDADTALHEAIEPAPAQATPLDLAREAPEPPPLLPVDPLGDAAALVGAAELVGAADAADLGDPVVLNALPEPTAKASPDDSPAVEPAEVLERADLDLADSAALVAAAQRVLELSAQAEATANAVRAAQLAEAEAQAAMAAERGRIQGLVAAAESFPNGEIPERYLCGVDFDAEVLLRCDAAQALTALNSAYRERTGRDLTVVSSYRTAARQAELHEEKGDLAAPAGASNHGRGIAVDFAGAGSLGEFDAPLYLWLSANAEAYGWIHPPYMEPGGSGPLEPWHWELDLR